MITIDKLCYHSKLRYVNAGEKFAFAVITLAICVISHSILIAGIVLAITGILTVWKGGIPISTYMRYLAAPLVFLILSTLAIVLNISQEPLDLFSISIGAWYLTGSRQAFIYALNLIFTALASVSCLYFLSFNTPMTDILGVMEKLRCPKLMIELMLLIYRYIFVLLETASAISIAQKSRLGNRNYITSLKSFAAMLSVVFIRSVKRSRMLYDAMESRCYDGTIHVLQEHFPPEKKDIVLIVIFETILLIILFLIKRGFGLW